MATVNRDSDDDKEFFDGYTMVICKICGNFWYIKTDEDDTYVCKHELLEEEKE